MKKNILFLTVGLLLSIALYIQFQDNRVLSTEDIQVHTFEINEEQEVKITFDGPINMSGFMAEKKSEDTIGLTLYREEAEEGEPITEITLSSFESSDIQKIEIAGKNSDDLIIVDISE